MAGLGDSRRCRKAIAEARMWKEMDWEGRGEGRKEEKKQGGEEGRKGRKERDMGDVNQGEVFGIFKDEGDENRRRCAVRS